MKTQSFFEKMGLQEVNPYRKNIKKSKKQQNMKIFMKDMCLNFWKHWIKGLHALRHCNYTEALYQPFLVTHQNYWLLELAPLFIYPYLDINVCQARMIAEYYNPITYIQGPP